MYHDLTLRDGSHAIAHQLTEDMIISHCKFAEDAGIEVVEVGHGCGNAASSILIGKSLLSDYDMISIAKKHLKKTKLSAHFIPGFATIERDLNLAISLGVDIFRIASHCTEASVTKSHIEYLASKGKTVYGVLMMTATCTTDILFVEASKMKSYGALAIIIMDSSGSFKPKDVTERIKKLTTLNIPIGFHGHNNYNLAVANSLAAIESGASIIDVTIKGFGAGAGNTPLEVMAFLHESPSINKTKLIEYCDNTTTIFAPTTKPIHLLTAAVKIASCFESHILKACNTNKISYVDFFNELAKHNLTAGQEDLVYILAEKYKNSKI